MCPLTSFCEENFWSMVSGELTVPYALTVSQNYEVLRPGPPVERRWLGGNLNSIEPLLGTPWEPVWDGAILFVEEFNAYPVRRDRILAYFRLVGESGQPESLDEITLRNCAGYSFPSCPDC